MHRRQIRSRSTALAVALAALLAFTTAGEAGPLGAWSLQIDNGAKRFTPLAMFDGEAVLDRETQLVWTRRVPNGDDFFWHVARDACAQTSKGGRKGWRLPTIAELTSLIEPSAAGSPKLPAGHPFGRSEGSLTEGIFWSSTPDAMAVVTPGLLGTYEFFAVDLETGDTEIRSALAPAGILCVRGWTGSGN